MLIFSLCIFSFNDYVLAINLVQILMLISQAEYEYVDMEWWKDRKMQESIRGESTMAMTHMNARACQLLSYVSNGPLFIVCRFAITKTPTRHVSQPKYQRKENLRRKQSHQTYYGRAHRIKSPTNLKLGPRKRNTQEKIPNMIKIL